MEELSGVRALDDASHASFHQQLTLARLFKAVEPGGLFIIEDMGWQPAGIEASLPDVPCTSRLLAELMRTGRMPRTAGISEEVAQYIEANTGAVTFYDESLLNDLGDSYNVRRGMPQNRHQPIDMKCHRFPTRPQRRPAILTSIPDRLREARPDAPSRLRDWRGGSNRV